MAMSQRYYREYGFVSGIDMEKVLGASFTGSNTRSGEMLSIRLKSANSQITLDANVHKLNYTLVSDGILSISLSGVNVLD